jgi:precorrin-6B methylase 2
MERMADWNALWARLVEAHKRTHSPDESVDPWRDRARQFAERGRRKWATPDPIREFLIARIRASDTVLDIGAGTGSWAVPLARVASRLTALEPSPSMREVLLETLSSEGVANVDVVDGSWPETEVAPHDVTLCSHAMYGVADLAAFVRRMSNATRRTCYLLMRAPTADGVMAAAARRVWGHPHDSPNFFVAHNVLADLGIRPNVLFDPNLWEPWTSPTLELAVADVKCRLDIEDSTEHDEFLRDLLRRRLVSSTDGYVWPRGIQSVLAYWDVASEPAGRGRA